MNEDYAEPLSIVARKLASISERNILFAFWGAFALAAATTVLQQPWLRVVNGIAQGALAFVWLGYPLAVFHCFAAPRIRTAGALILMGAVALALVLNIRGTAAASSDVLAAAIFVLILAPFAAAAHALQSGERRANGRPGTNIFLSTLEFIALPFFGALVHSRVRNAIRTIASAE
jgi:multisubunit Na+/H+ antiporter MnhG subunit